MCGLAYVFHDETDEKNGLVVNQLNPKNLRLVFIVTWEGTWRFPSNNLCFMAGAQGYPPQRRVTVVKSLLHRCAVA
jgi:hypothetical protein